MARQFAIAERVAKRTRAYTTVLRVVIEEGGYAVRATVRNAQGERVSHAYSGPLTWEQAQDRYEGGVAVYGTQIAFVR